jgi:hypothetical protein
MQTVDSLDYGFDDHISTRSNNLLVAALHATGRYDTWPFDEIGASPDVVPLADDFGRM